ncbi:hypothetical protein ASE86_03885 [Sphingomonas sp. Leaf33]|uniref:hypothetical protein n=1 Tax=Sphingomonas sp. Leaf33 TaxID=1736215 RepID=UPI0006FFB43F|nr:hypothetical protein [Sphingomonas sp. Leaf33]KQN25392.1 hypothetical protein ASE86_03885 [Sphingomonas sp. Leaf33]
MMRPLRLALALPIALAVGGCGSDQSADPGGMTASEAQELNDAAAMLDANAVDLNAVTEPGNRS